MDLDNNDDRMGSLLTDVRGRKFYGFVQVNSVLRTQTDLADYLLQVNRACFITGGDAIVWDEHKFILGRGVTEDNGGPLFRSLRMITVTHELAWTRAASTVDPITGLEKKASTTSLGTALCALQATSNIADEFRVATSKFALITNSPVQVDDRLGSYVVTFVEPRHDLIYAEAR